MKKTLQALILLAIISVIGIFVLIQQENIGMNLSQYDTSLPSNLRVQVMSGNSVILRSSDKTFGTRAIGSLSHQFGADAPIQTLLFEVGTSRFIIGKVDETVAGTVDLVEFQAVPVPSYDWMKATKSSTVKQRIFLIPIMQSEYTSNDTLSWNKLARVGVNTKESYKKSSPLVEDSGSAWSKRFTPPIDIENLFTKIL